MKPLKFFIVLFSASLIFSACTHLNSTETPSTEVGGEIDQVAPPEEVVSPEEVVRDEVVAYELTAVNFEYSTDDLTAAPGQEMQVRLIVKEGMHDFVIDELEVRTDVMNAGEETTVTVMIPEDAEPGTEYPFYCSVGNHREMGMEGTLTVTAAADRN